MVGFSGKVLNVRGKEGVVGGNFEKGYWMVAREMALGDSLALLADLTANKLALVNCCLTKSLKLYIVLITTSL